MFCLNDNCPGRSSSVPLSGGEMFDDPGNDCLMAALWLIPLPLEGNSLLTGVE